MLDDITSQHSDIMAMCCTSNISSFVTFSVVDVGICRCRP